MRGPRTNPDGPVVQHLHFADPGRPDVHRAHGDHQIIADLRDDIRLRRIGIDITIGLHVGRVQQPDLGIHMQRDALLEGHDLVIRHHHRFIFSPPAAVSVFIHRHHQHVIFHARGQSADPGLHPAGHFPCQGRLCGRKFRVLGHVDFIAYRVLRGLQIFGRLPAHGQAVRRIRIEQIDPRKIRRVFPQNHGLEIDNVEQAVAVHILGVGTRGQAENAVACMLDISVRDLPVVVQVFRHAVGDLIVVGGILGPTGPGRQQHRQQQHGEQQTGSSYGVSTQERLHRGSSSVCEKVGFMHLVPARRRRAPRRPHPSSLRAGHRACLEQYNTVDTVK